MEATNFKGSNITFGPPKGLSEAQVGTIPAFMGKQNIPGVGDCPLIMVAWKPNYEEIKRLMDGGNVYVCFLSNGLVPHFVITENLSEYEVHHLPAGQIPKKEEEDPKDQITKAD